MQFAAVQPRAAHHDFSTAAQRAPMHMTHLSNVANQNITPFEKMRPPRSADSHHDSHHEILRLSTNHGLACARTGYIQSLGRMHFSREAAKNARNAKRSESRCQRIFLKRRRGFAIQSLFLRDFAASREKNLLSKFAPNYECTHMRVVAKSDSIIARNVQSTYPR